MCAAAVSGDAQADAQAVREAENVAVEQPLPQSGYDLSGSLDGMLDEGVLGDQDQAEAEPERAGDSTPTLAGVDLTEGEANTVSKAWRRMREDLAAREAMTKAAQAEAERATAAEADAAAEDSYVHRYHQYRSPRPKGGVRRASARRGPQ